MATDQTRRICRTPEECFEAGWQACEERGDKLSPERADLVLAILRPHLRRDTAA